MRRLMRILIILTVIAGAMAVLYAWARSNRDSGPGYELIAVERGDITEKALAVGVIEPRVTYHVKSKISGIVERCFVEVGETVEPGDALFRIAPDPTPQEVLAVEHDLRSARSSHQKAKSDFERGRSLQQQGLSSASDLDGLREAFELASNRLEEARSNLELVRQGRVTEGAAALDTIIRAQAAGTILSRSVDPGDPVVPLTSYQPGTEMAEIAEMGDLIFRGTVDEIDVGKIDVGQTCRIKVGALPDQPVTGRLFRIAPQAKSEEGATLFDVEIELDPDQGVVLRAGYSANADIIIREKRDVLLIPERLVTFDEDETTTVELPGETPEADPRRVEVDLGLSDGLSVEVLSGLEEDDRVVQRPPPEIS